MRKSKEAETVSDVKVHKGQTGGTEDANEVKGKQSGSRAGRRYKGKQQRGDEAVVGRELCITALTQRWQAESWSVFVPPCNHAKLTCDHRIASHVKTRQFLRAAGH